MPESNVEPVPEPPTTAARSDRSGWYWLLVVPVIAPLLTTLYNRDSPRLFDIPAFYWLQLLFIALGVGTTALVYQMTKRRG
ncbi:MAG TPA: DUF3311 domain-containing protein [Micromonosporaceae bacterium]|nr:DUF3311 domain-containing protein [Micromonosporaceae bacterium]